MDQQRSHTPKRRRQAGFTLMEMLISVGFMASLAGLISSSQFLTVRTQRETNAVADVAVQTARTANWLIRDVHQAETTTLADPTTGATSATFAWDDGGPISCTYLLVNTTLMRDCGSGQQPVGSFINNLMFDRSGDLITAHYQIVPPTSTGKTQQIDLNIAFGGG